MNNQKMIYRVQFMHEGERYEIYVKAVNQSYLFGFIELGEFAWEAQTSLVVDPSYEKLKDEFKQVLRTHVPLHNILKIDEVEKTGPAKITNLGKNVTQFPRAIYTPKNTK